MDSEHVERLNDQLRAARRFASRVTIDVHRRSEHDSIQRHGNELIEAIDEILCEQRTDAPAAREASGDE